MAAAATEVRLNGADNANDAAFESSTLVRRFARFTRPRPPLSFVVSARRVSLIVALAIGALALESRPAAARALAQDVVSHAVSGVVVDPSGATVSGALVTLATSSGSRTVRSDADGRFAFDAVPAGPLVLTVTLDHFASSVVRLDRVQQNMRVTLRPATVVEDITVRARPPAFPRSTIATRTDAPLRDVPQSVTVLPQDLIADAMIHGMGEAMRYVPGVGVAQGEGHRDAPIFRGNTSTADFFVDGVRDDTQYLRDVYNAERIEVLKGPSGMLFGRGGLGGVINRVTRQANWASSREVAMTGGSFGHRRVTMDVGETLSSRVSARLTGLVEHSDTYRDQVNLESYGFNPTVAFALSANTTLRGGYEFFMHDRTVDRGVPSFAGSPLPTGLSTFFGNADVNVSDVTVHFATVNVEHRRGDRFTVKSRLNFADYDKFYQNLVPGAVSADAMTVSLSGYNSGTTRQNVFHQTDLTYVHATGPVVHTVVAGVELGRQVTDNRRLTAFFPSVGAGVTSVSVPVSDPTTALPLEFRAVSSDANNRGIATTAAAYVQDQLALSSRVHAIVGIRFDRFEVDLLDRRTDSSIDSVDNLLSPRVGIVYKPTLPVSLYGSYSLSYLPRAGEQLSSLSLSNRALDPEEFENVEVGAKWEATPHLAFSTAVYRLNRGNVAVADPLNPTVSLLVDAERTTGVELEVTGTISSRWRVQGGYAYQDAEVTRSLSSTVLAGARLGQVPAHSVALWNRYDLSRRWGVGLGVSSRSRSFVATDNAVTLPSFTRVDAAVFFAVNARLRLQANIENLFDEAYYPAAHNNNNITPGSPRALRVMLDTRF